MMRTIRTLLATTAVTTVAALMLAIALVAPAAAQPAPDRISDNANVRSRPHPDAPILGQGAFDHHVTIHCYVRGPRPRTEPGGSNATNTWWYLTDHTIARTGYVWGTYAHPKRAEGRRPC